jgi:AraC family transcriptional regulator, transcriptional activator of pobA
MKNLPVFDLSGLSEIRHHDVLVSRFAPYLKVHHKLRVPHGHSFYHVVFFTEGTGQHTIDFDSFEVKSNQMYFMIPGQVHNWHFDSAVDGFVINFSAAFFQSFLLRSDYLDQFVFFRGKAADSVVELPDGAQAKIRSLFEEMLLLDTSVRGMDKLRVLMLQVFFIAAETRAESLETGPSSYNVTVLRNFQSLIEKHFNTLRLPKQYAELLFVTPNHLNAICSQMLGTSAGELIRKRILLEAKRLLINLEIPIATIAYELNFKDNSYFSKFFKKLEGCTPEEFRKQIQK